MADEVMNKIKQLDAEIRQKMGKVLRMRHKWLRDKGWEITGETIGPTMSYFYQKYGELYICEHDAIDRELNGK